jgi:hypothetical protein
MKRIVAIPIFAIAVVVTPAPAQRLFKKAKVNPAQRVPELILIVKTDADERKRIHAAEELRDYDAATFTEIVPVLADVLLLDKKAAVRLEALHSLAKIRPVSATAGQAMEKAAADDEALRVRLQARTALTRYHLAGYSSKKGPTTSTSAKPATAEPPVNDPPLPAPRIDVPRRLPPGVATPGQGPSLVR